MSCLKIRLRDLPELINAIIEYLQNDYSTLHSCVLVNRLWCQLAIPLLWENPFAISNRNYNFIEVYLFNLNDHLKLKLNEYQIIDNLLPSTTLFNYSSFLKYMNTFSVINSVDKWWFGVSKLSNRSFTQDTFGQLVCASLFTMFIENIVSLNTLEVEISSSYSNYHDNVLELILQSPNFICNIRNLEFNIERASNKVKDHMSQLVNLQKNLKKVLFGTNSYPLYKSLLLSKKSACSYTLNTIIFYYVDFNNVNNLTEAIEGLNVLESVHLIYSYPLDINFIRQIINLTKPFRLKSLFFNEISQIESLRLLLQKSGSYLENFEYGLGISRYDQLLKIQLLDLIIKYCKSIKFLDVNKIENNTISLVIFSLIENIKQNLNHLHVNLSNYRNIDINLIFQNLGKSLPFKLEYLSLAFRTKAIDFEVFLKNSQDTFFKKLVINNIKQDHDDYIDILPCIKEYILKDKRVEYLAIKNTVKFVTIIDLINLREEVKEFESNHIKVVSYNKLSTDCYCFLKD